MARRPLTPKQEQFIFEYVKDQNGTRAYMAAYPKVKESSAGVNAARLLGNARIKKEIEKGLAERASRVKVTADDVLQELKRLAMVDLNQIYDKNGDIKAVKDMPEDCRRAIAGIKTYFKKGKGIVHEIKFWDKNKSLEALGRHLKLFTEKHEHEHTGKDGQPLNLAPQVILTMPANGRERKD